MNDGLTLKIDNDFLAISALLDDARRNEERAMALFARLRAVLGDHFGQIVVMTDTNALAQRIDDELRQMKARAGITAETPVNRCGKCWTLTWNDGNCWNCDEAQK